MNRNGAESGPHLPAAWPWANEERGKSGWYIRRGSDALLLLLLANTSPIPIHATRLPPSLVSNQYLLSSNEPFNPVRPRVEGCKWPACGLCELSQAVRGPGTAPGPGLFGKREKSMRKSFPSRAARRKRIASSGRAGALTDSNEADTVCGESRLVPCRYSTHRRSFSAARRIQGKRGEKNGVYFTLYPTHDRWTRPGERGLGAD